MNERSNGRIPPRSLSATAAAITLFASLSSFETLYAESEKTDVGDEESGGDIEFVQYGGSAHEKNLAKQKRDTIRGFRTFQSLRTPLARIAILFGNSVQRYLAI